MKGETRVGDIYKHPSGIRYQVDKVLFNATNYEKTSKLSKVVLYTQLDDGKYSKGTQWVRSEEDFICVFKQVPEE